MIRDVSRCCQLWVLCGPKASRFDIAKGVLATHMLARRAMRLPIIDLLHHAVWTRDSVGSAASGLTCTSSTRFLLTSERSCVYEGVPVVCRRVWG